MLSRIASFITAKGEPTPRGEPATSPPPATPPPAAPPAPALVARRNDIAPASDTVDAVGGRPLGQVGQVGQVAGARPAISTAPVAGGQKPWQTRLELKDKTTSAAVAKAVLAVMAGLPADLLLEPVRSAALALTEGQTSQDPQAMQRVYQRCLQQLDPEAVAESLGHLAVAVNDAAHAATTPLRHRDEVPRGKSDAADWHRTWGLRLLPDNDPCFRDPKYLVALNQESKGIRATTHEGRTSLTSSRERFEAALAKLAPTARLLAVTESGSDAVSMAFQLAIALGRRRQVDGETPFAAATPKLGFFDGVYGGSRGTRASLNFEGWGEKTSEDLSAWRLPSPTSFQRTPVGPELQRVMALETEALAALTRQLENKKEPLGAIFLEPVQGANGVRFYRTGFILAVRALADKHGVAIIADEVLTGGGRTGKMFAYEHYAGFEPDFVLFGKGLQAAGVLAVGRQGRAESQKARTFDLGVTTAGGDATRFLKGAQVLDRIRESNLIANAAEVGAYLEQRLQDVQRRHGATPDASGVGLLVGVQRIAGANVEVSHSPGKQRDRYMPPLTLTKADVDAVVEALLKKADFNQLATEHENLVARRNSIARDGPTKARDELDARIEQLEQQLGQLAI